MLTLILVGVGCFAAGGIVNGKLILPALHNRPSGSVRDFALRALNGGPGPVPAPPPPYE